MAPQGELREVAAVRQGGLLDQPCRIMCLFHRRVVFREALLQDQLRLAAVERLPALLLAEAPLVMLLHQQPA